MKQAYRLKNAQYRTKKFEIWFINFYELATQLIFWATGAQVIQEARRKLQMV